MDRNEKLELKLFIERTITKTLRASNERWLSKEQLCEQFQMFTPSWMKTYGHLLPCSQAIVIDDEGIPHESRKAYPMYQIQDMIQSGQIKDLTTRVNR